MYGDVKLCLGLIELCAGLPQHAETVWLPKMDYYISRFPVRCRGQPK